eukprot:NODE_27555_length_509_cov_1.918848.p1 GENE.NODE_27555_length_509_cov_1.918848~~NODE_27555_length_509_cov_1.918848.p1  ORF type:complete len:97 (-),score=13.33 NODE_27555_length_509_cov_1.918848:82-372(-)
MAVDWCAAGTITATALAIISMTKISSRVATLRREVNALHALAASAFLGVDWRAAGMVTVWPSSTWLRPGARLRHASHMHFMHRLHQLFQKVVFYWK